MEKNNQLEKVLSRIILLFKNRYVKKHFIANANVSNFLI